MEEWVSTPSDVYEFLLGYPWPIKWAYAMLAGVAVLAAVCSRRPARTEGRLDSEPPASLSWRRRFRRLLPWLPFAWFIWQLLAASNTSAPDLTVPVTAHFLAAVSCFYVGYFALSRAPVLNGFWLPLLICFWFVLIAGWSQHFGGLEQTRRYFYLYVYPQLQEVPPEYLKKMTSSRIFATLFYPNALAGALLLLLPGLLAWSCGLRRWLTPGARALVAGATAVAALGCLAWSGSKGGWLIALGMSVLALLRLPLGKRFRVLLVSGLLVAGAAGFLWRYATFFQRGATSVGARFDYWRAALVVTRENPLTGSGPGTFGRAYSAIKAPESEPARLAHNDYLQQASDSGIPGLLLYAGFVSGAIWLTYPRQPRNGTRTVAPSFWGRTEDWHRYATWLGLAGWSLQGMMEFGLYIPALAWPAFALFGWSLGLTRSSGPSSPDEPATGPNPPK